MHIQSPIEFPTIYFGDYYSKSDFPIFRIAETNLIVAEAALEISRPATAYQFIEALAHALAYGGNGSELMAFV